MSQSDGTLIQEQFDDWLAHPVTVRVRAALRAERLSLMEKWANGVFLSTDGFSANQQNFRAMARAELIQEILTLEPEQLELEDGEEHERG